MKPCPLCGGAPHGPLYPDRYVRCVKCGLTCGSEHWPALSALRVQRDEAVARLAEFADGRAAQKMAKLANDLAGELEESERTRTTDYQEWMACEAVISSHAKMLADMNAESLKIEDHCRAAEKERDEAVAERDACHRKNKLLRSVLMTALLHIDDSSPDVAAALRARLKDGE